MEKSYKPCTALLFNILIVWQKKVASYNIYYVMYKAERIPLYKYLKITAVNINTIIKINYPSY